MVDIIFDNGKVFSADAIIGKTLIARKDLTVINSSGMPIGYVKAGQPVGVVYSFLEPKPGTRSVLWWAFNVNGFFYYVAHAAGLFDVSAIKAQGVLSLDEIYQKQLEQADSESRGWLSKMLGLPSASTVATGFSNVLITGGLLAGGIYLLGQVIKKKL